MQTAFTEGSNVGCIKGGQDLSTRDGALPAIRFSYGDSKRALPESWRYQRRGAVSCLNLSHFR
jgi:hypothetical protein